MADEMTDRPDTSQPAPTAPPEGITVTWRRSLFGLGTALCFALSAIFIRAGLEDLPSPLLGVTVGMVVTAAVYGVILLFRREQPRLGTYSRDVIFFQLTAAVLVGLSTWARWIALDLAPLAVVMALGRLNVPVVILLSPLLVGRHLERVTPRVWLGAALIIIGSLILNFFA
jgi:uncharacterized membrane protein